MRLANITGQRVAEYLQNRQTIMIPVGSIENHGMHMPLGTDMLIPDRIAQLVEEKSDVLIAPTVPYGATEQINGCTGTVSLDADGLALVLSKITNSLYRYGFRKFIILNGHGGNNKAIESVGIQLHKKGAWLACLNWWQMAGELRPEWKGGHGGAEETAGVMGVDPSLIDRRYLHEPMNQIDDVAPNMRTTGWTTVEYKGATVTFPRESKHYHGNGWYGTDAPYLATEEWGREMLQTMADYIVDFVDEFEKIPLPPVEN